MQGGIFSLVRNTEVPILLNPVWPTSEKFCSLHFIFNTLCGKQRFYVHYNSNGEQTQGPLLLLPAALHLRKNTSWLSRLGLCHGAGRSPALRQEGCPSALEGASPGSGWGVGRSPTPGRISRGPSLLLPPHPTPSGAGKLRRPGATPSTVQESTAVPVPPFPGLRCFLLTFWASCCRCLPEILIGY